MGTRLLICASCICLSGCIFGAGGSTENNGVDLGDQDQGGNANDTGTSPDDGTPNTDMGTSEDAGPGPIDAGGGDDMPTSAEDAGTDTGQAPRWTVVADYVLPESATAGAAAVAQVSRFKDGFLAGYTSAAGKTWVGWFDSDETQARSSEVYDGNLPGLDLAGDATYGYAVMVTGRQRIAVRFEDAQNTGTFDSFLDGHETSSSDVMLTEIAVAIDEDRPYIPMVRRTNTSQHLDLGLFTNSFIVGPNLFGYAIENIEVTGNNVSQGRAIYVTGETEASYTLVDFSTDGGPWSAESFGCGPLPANDARVVPVVQRWVLANLDDFPAPKMSWVRCTAQGPGGRIEVGRPAQGSPVTDFDVAEESLSLPTPGLAWITGTQVWFGLLNYQTDPDSAEIVDAWSFLDDQPIHVRTAFNPERAQFAVVVHTDTDIRLYILAEN